jgi:anti-anti-sigma factor
VFCHLEVRKENDLVVVQFVEDRFFDEQIVRETAEELCEAASQARGHILVLDFSTVVALSGAMLARLITLQKKLEQEGGQLRLCHVAKELREVLAATKLDHLLHIEKDKPHRSGWHFALVPHTR